MVYTLNLALHTHRDTSVSMFVAGKATNISLTSGSSERTVDSLPIHVYVHVHA